MRFDVTAVAQGDSTRLSVTTGRGTDRFVIAGREQHHYRRFYAALSARFGTRRPHDLAGHRPAPADPRWRALLTDNLSERILCGYGDPAVLRTDDAYMLVATSNDAPDAFPILLSNDLTHWRHEGFVFARGQHPCWTAAGVGVGDYWAPEMARVGDSYWLIFTARDRDGILSIGLARADRPTGPWHDIGRPLLRDGVIDAHLFVEDDAPPILFWKEDRNSRWPRPLAHLLRDRPALIDTMFDTERDQATAGFCAAIVEWAEGRPPMERFFLMQPLIRAVLDDLPRVRRVLRDAGGAEAILEAMRTPILAQRLNDDGSALLGEPIEVLVNDQLWEGHLIEGPWVTRQRGRYWLFYAGNDFTVASYGIGVASAADPFGPYVKQEGPLLRSTTEWTAPGHASVATGLDGRPTLFFHAFRPGEGGYNAFRALLSVGLDFGEDGVALR